MANSLKIGSTIPAFSVLDQNSHAVTHEDILGHKTVLFFYPADMTPTCTTEACNIRDNHHRFLDAGYKVYGVSPDSPASHLKFIKKYDLPYDLLSDETNNMIKSFGIWGEKKLFGRDYMGLLRTTFVIDEEGKIVDIISKVNADEHAEQILASV